ncbi:MAG: hypothetical protein ABI369_03930 [Acetobacteraceae bacterium]
MPLNTLRQSLTHTLAGVGTALVDGYVQLELAAASVVDVTVRVGGPRLEQGSVAMPVVYPPTVLNEPAATNKIENSAGIGGTDWSETGLTVTANATMAPDGTTTASLLTETTATSTHLASQTAQGAYTIGASYVLSVFLKANGSKLAGLTASGEGNAIFDLEHGVLVSISGSVTAANVIFLANGWWRCSATFVKATTSAVFSIGTSGSVGSYTGSGSNSIYAWGAQVEVGNAATSYIATAIGATATRAADSLFLAPPRFIYLDPPYASLTSYFTGMATQWTLTEIELQIPIRDATYWLEQPLQTTLYLGTGGYESPVPWTGAPPPPPNSTSLKGMTKPKCRGGSANWPIRNVTPILVDPVNLIYQYTDAPGTVVALYEGGSPNHILQGDVADLYVGTTNAGQYRTSNVRGMFQLGSNPVQAITVDVTGAFPDGTAANTMGAVAYNLLAQDISVPAANLHGASFTAFDAMNAWTVGVYFGSEGTVYVPFSGPSAVSSTGVAAMTTLLAGVGAQLYPARDGTLRMFLLEAIPPTTAAEAFFDTSNVVSVASKLLPSNLNPPPYRMRVGYQHNYTVQQQAALSPVIDQNLLQFVQAQDRFASASSNAILIAFNRPNDTPPIPTCLLAPNDAQAAANILIGLWGTRRRLYDIVVPFAVGVLRELGDIILLTWPMDNLRGGQLGQVVGETFNSGDPTITLTVLI